MNQVIKKEFDLVKIELDRKKSVLNLPAVLERVSQKELRIADLSIGVPISKIPDRDLRIVNGEEKERGLIERTGIIAKGIARDFAIRNIDRGDAFRFFDILKKYYSTLTLDEVRTAFELALVGELDPYLPKDRNGVADKNHYQAFSVEFVTRILNAYKSYRGKVWTKINVSSEKQEKEVTEEEKREFKEGFLSVIRDYYKSWSDGNGLVIMFPATVVEWLIAQGHVKDRELTDADYNKALVAVKTSAINGIEKKNILERFKEGNHDGKLESEATRIKNEELIIKAFKNIKKKGVEL